ncbi:hypothetical protein D3C84_1068160 [compost metagenome]
MIVEGALQFGLHAFSQAVLGHDQYRLQMVADRFEMFLLLVGKRHNLILRRGNCRKRNAFALLWRKLEGRITQILQPFLPSLASLAEVPDGF